MKTLRFYKILVLILVVINLITLFFLMKTGNEKHPPFGPRKSLVTILDLKGEAADKIKVLELEHFRLKDSLVDHSRKLHEELFHSFNNSEKDSTDISTLIDKIVENQRENEQMTFEYFKKVDALCNEQQREELQNVIHHALRHMGGPPPPKRK